MIITPKRALFAVALGGALTFAYCGGEYSTRDWLGMRRDAAREQDRITELERTVDSLAALASALATDLETQERVARERHGMLKPGEHAFILEDAPSREP